MTPAETIWAPLGLRVTTPVLSLEYVTDELGVRLAELAAEGIHDPETMPFAEPWTDVAPPELQRNTLRYLWRSRAETVAERWALNFAARDAAGAVIGMCSLDARDFPTARTASTGSWVGRRHQRRGLGREMRHAALHLLFAGLGAKEATTRAWHDNEASLRLTRSLPYREGPPVEALRRGRPTTMRVFAMPRGRWESVRRGDVELSGVDAARKFLEIG